MILKKIKGWLKKHHDKIVGYSMAIAAIGVSILFINVKNQLWIKKYTEMPMVVSDQGFYYKLDQRKREAHFVRYEMIHADSLTIPSTINFKGKDYQVKHISYRAFIGRKDLQKIKLPEGIISIKNGAFLFCENLRTIVLPNTVKEIENQAFKGCTNLRTIVIPPLVKRIYAGTFDGCSNLTTMVFLEGKKKLEFRNNKELYDLPIKTLYLGRLCYKDNGRSPTDYDIFDIKTLETLILGNEPFYIGSAWPIGDDGFHNCRNLKNIYCINKEPYDLNFFAFRYSHYESTILNVPEGAIEEYKDSWIWSKFKNIREYRPEELKFGSIELRKRKGT